MSEKDAENHENNGNTALDWEIFDVLCREELGLGVSKVDSVNKCEIYLFSGIYI